MPKSFLPLCMREWRRILDDPRIFALICVVPFIYAFLFGGEYWAGTVRHIPIAIVDQDHSRLSRDITTSLAASESLKINAALNSPQDFLTLVRREKAFACVVFPAHLERDVLGGRNARVGFIVDGSNLVLGNLTFRAFNMVLTTYRVGISAEELSRTGVTSSTARNAAMPIQAVLRAPFNTTFNYSHFILMGLICVVAQQVTRLGAGLALGMDEVDDLWRNLPEPVARVRLVWLAKLAAIAVLVLPVAGMAIALPFVLYGAPFRGNLVFFSAVFALYMVMQIAIGLGFCAFTKQYLMVTHAHLFMSSIQFILSGFTWPYYAMPPWVRPLVYCFPIFHMNSLLRKVALDGAGPVLVMQHLLPLLVWLPVSMAWGYWGVRKQMVRTGRANML